MFSCLSSIFPDYTSCQKNYDRNGAVPSWDNERVLSDQYDDEYIPNDVEVSDEILSQTCQVLKLFQLFLNSYHLCTQLPKLLLFVPYKLIFLFQM